MRSFMSVTITLCVGLLLSLLVKFTPPPASAEPASAAPAELGALKDDLEHIKTTLEGFFLEICEYFGI